MIRSRSLLWIFAFLAVLALGPPARADDGLDRARQLVEEARPFSKRSGDPDLDHSKRKAARKEAYVRLKEARGLFDAYLDANPSRVESLDGEYVELASMLYWIKKMASINEFDDARPGPVELPPTKSSGDGGTGRPAPPGDGDGDGDADGTAPTKPDPAAPTEAPEEIRARQARESFEAIEEIDRSNSSDVPRLHDLYARFLAEYDDPSLREYTKAAMRLGALADRMKRVFKEQVGQDPDAIKDVDGEDVDGVVLRLSKSIRSHDVEERRHAADLLGNLGSGAASIALVNAMKDDDPLVAASAAGGLGRLGGTRACYNLTKSFRDAKPELQTAALGVLAKIAALSEVDARTASEFIGRFALANDEAIGNAAIDQLIAMGFPGGPGLIEALKTRQHPKKIRAIEGLGKVKYYPGAKNCAMYLLRGKGEKASTQREAARTALETMGMPIVGDLIDMLRSTKHRHVTHEVLRKITGQNFPMKYTALWRDWWRKNKPEGVE